MYNIKYKSIAEIKEHIKTGDYEIISQLTRGKYKPETVRRQLNSHRTLKPEVIIAANKLINSRERLLSM